MRILKKTNKQTNKGGGSWLDLSASRWSPWQCWVIDICAKIQYKSAAVQTEIRCVVRVIHEKCFRFFFFLIYILICFCTLAIGLFREWTAAQSSSERKCTQTRRFCVKSAKENRKLYLVVLLPLSRTLEPQEASKNYPAAGSLRGTKLAQRQQTFSETNISAQTEQHHQHCRVLGAVPAVFTAK